MKRQSVPILFLLTNLAILLLNTACTHKPLVNLNSQHTDSSSSMNSEKFRFFVIDTSYSPLTQVIVSRCLVENIVVLEPMVGLTGQSPTARITVYNRSAKHLILEYLFQWRDNRQDPVGVHQPWIRFELAPKDKKVISDIALNNQAKLAVFTVRPFEPSDCASDLQMIQYSVNCDIFTEESMSTEDIPPAIYLDNKKVHIQQGLPTSENFVALAGVVAEDMIQNTPSWFRKNMSSFFVELPENKMHEVKVVPKNLQTEIIARIINAGVATVIDDPALSFRCDYHIKTTLSDLKISDMLSLYTCNMELRTLRGQSFGQWHGTIGLMRQHNSDPE